LCFVCGPSAMSDGWWVLMRDASVVGCRGQVRENLNK
jgi:hypothetical protein